MMSPVSTSVPLEDGSDRYVTIEPVLENGGKHRYRSAGVYKIYKDTFGRGSQADDLPDEHNPDYLGKMVFEGGTVQRFEGTLLSVAEQAYLAVFIDSYQEPDI
jgi:hypothetical protein